MFLEREEGSLYFECEKELATSSKPALMVLPGGPRRDHTSFKQYLPELNSFANCFFALRGT